MSLVCGLESGPQPSAFHEGIQACAEAVSSLNTLFPHSLFFLCGLDFQEGDD